MVIGNSLVRLCSEKARAEEAQTVRFREKEEHGELKLAVKTCAERGEETRRGLTRIQLREGCPQAQPLAAKLLTCERKRSRREQ